MGTVTFFWGLEWSRADIYKTPHTSALVNTVVFLLLRICLIRGCCGVLGETKIKGLKAPAERGRQPKLEEECLVLRGLLNLCRSRPFYREEQ